MSKVSQKQSSIQLKPGETLTGKDYIEYMKTILKSSNDPIWFIKEILGFPLYPVQEEIIREYYKHKYDNTLQELKKLILVAGQRCKEKDSLISTNSGLKKIKELFPSHLDKSLYINKPIKLIDTLVFNGVKWTPATEIIYAGRKKNCIITTENDIKIEGSKDHKYLVFNDNNRSWKRVSELKKGDYLEFYPDIYLNNNIINNNIINNNVKHVKIKSIEYTDSIVEMYDLHVPDGNCYVADGILSHNSGKTAMASSIMAYELFELIKHDKPAEHFNLAPGAMLAITCVAVSRDQANYGVFANMTNMLEKNEWFKQWFDDFSFKDQRIESKQRQIMAQVLAANVATAAGYTNKCVVFDELDLFQQSLTSKISADLVYTKLCNSTQTFKEKGKIIAISSLQYIDGLMSSIYKDGLDEPQTLAIEKRTWEINPTITEQQLRDEYKYNMVAFYRDFANKPGVASGLQFPEGVALNPHMINVLSDDYVPEYEKKHPYHHVMCIDPAYKNDSFGVSTAYRKHNHLIVDGVRKFTNMYNSGGDAFIKPSDIRLFIERKIPELNITGFVHDIYMYPEILESVKYKFGIIPVMHQVKNEDYNRWREIQDKTGELRNYELNIVYDQDLQREANRLITKRLDSGRVKTDHTWRESKDVSDTVANCIWYLTAYQPSDFTYTPVGYHILG